MEDNPSSRITATQIFDCENISATTLLPSNVVSPLRGYSSLFIRHSSLHETTQLDTLIPLNTFIPLNGFAALAKL